MNQCGSHPQHSTHYKTTETWRPNITATVYKTTQGNPYKIVGVKLNIHDRDYLKSLIIDGKFLVILFIIFFDNVRIYKKF